MTGAFEGASFVAVGAVRGPLEEVEVARGFLIGGEIKDARLTARDAVLSDGFEVLVVGVGFFSVAVGGLAIGLTPVEVDFAAGVVFVVGAGVVLLVPNVPELRI